MNARLPPSSHPDQHRAWTFNLVHGSCACCRYLQVPLKQLVEFERLSDIGPGKSTAVTFSLDPYVSLSLTAANGSKVVYPVRTH